MKGNRVMSKRIIAIAFTLGLGLAACAGTASSLSSLASSAIGQSFLTAIFKNLAPGIDAAIAKGAAAGAPELKVAAYALPWAQGAVDLFGSALGMSAAAVTATDGAIRHAEADVAAALANPAGVNAVALLGEVKAIWDQVTVDLAPATKA
jgi:hypothetical protein